MCASSRDDKLQQQDTLTQPVRAHETVTAENRASRWSAAEHLQSRARAHPSRPPVHFRVSGKGSASKAGLVKMGLRTIMLAVGASAAQAATCDALVGKTFSVAEYGVPPLSFAEQRTDGIYLDQTIPAGQKFLVMGLTHNNLSDYTVLSQDGRHLNISCSALTAALSSAYPGQHVLPSDSVDFAHAERLYEARQAAVTAEARRRQKAGVESQANRGEEIGD